MAFLEIGGTSGALTAVKTPSAFHVQIYDESAPDSGRTLDGVMHKNKIDSKRTIEIEWWNTTPAETAAIINAFQAHEYFRIKYWDPTNATTQLTKTFYLGDRDAPIRQWFANGKRYEKVAFTIIER